jgi:zinc/manganese transport system substrate-binding protein
MAALLAVSVVALTATGCAPSGSSSGTASADTGSNAKIQVVASINTWGNLAEIVGGDYVTVKSIISDPLQDPHSYQATVRDQLAVSKARFVLANGAGYDSFMDTLAMSAKKGVFHIASNLTNPSYGTNPHIWYSIAADREAAQLIAHQFGAIAPEHAAYFTQNAAKFNTRMALLQMHQTGLTQGNDIRVLSVESLADLMLNESGIKIATPKAYELAVQNDIDISPKALAEAKALITDGKVQLLVLNAQESSPASKALAAAAEATASASKAAGRKPVAVVSMSELLPPGKDFIEWMVDNVAAIENALIKTGVLKEPTA